MTGWIVAPYDLLVGRVVMRRTYRRVAETISRELPAGGAVCDVGTGTGRLVLALARRRPDLSITGIDPSADMLERARRNADGLSRVRFLEAPAEAIPLEDASCDAVVSTLSSHHWANLPAAVNEQGRVLRSGGRFWLYDLRRELSDELPAAVAAAGLRVEPAESGLAGLNARRLRLLAAVKS